MADLRAHGALAHDLLRQQQAFVYPSLQHQLVAEAHAATTYGSATISSQQHHRLAKQVFLDPRTYLPLISALSLLAFVVQFLVVPQVTAFLRRKRAYQPVSSRSSETSATLVGSDDDDGSLAGTEVKGLGYVKRSGGWGVVVWSLLRFASLVGLEVLTVIAAIRTKGKKESVEAWCLVGSIGYCVILSLLSLTVRPSVVSAKTRALKAHLVWILLATWTIYFTRDIYPLATFTIEPLDKLDAIMWTRLSLLTFAAIIVPLCSPRTHIPVSAPFGAYEPAPEQTASYLSLYSFAFLDSLIFKAWRVESVPYEDFPPLQDVDSASWLRKKAIWRLDPYSKDPRAPIRSRHIGLRIIRVWWKEVSLSFLLAAAYTVMQLADVVGLNRLLHYLETNGEGAVARPWVWIFLLGFGPFGQSTLWNCLIYLQTRFLVRAEATLTLTLFQHALRIQPRDKACREEDEEEAKAGQNLVGRINSLMSSDLNAIIQARLVPIYGVAAPLGTVLAAVGLWKLLGPASLVAMALSILQIPIPAKLTSLSLGVQKKFAQSTDARVQRIGEAIGALRITKLFGLEEQVKKQINDLRAKELELNKSRKLIRLGLSCVMTLLPLAVMIATFSWFTIVQKGTLTASVVFSSISVFNLFSMSLQEFLMLSNFVDSWVSLQRINTFLQTTPLLDRYEDDGRLAISDDPTYIGFKNATFAWLKDAEPDARNFRLHFDELRFPQGKISIVAGPTGSGKSSLLHALLGEMHFESKDPESSYGLPRTGGVAYASQQSWLRNATLRANILGPADDGAPFDEERYRKTVKQCGLERDFSLFDAGDETEVGERGLTLSGGQKARITLARAVYSHAQVLLLDDVLSALDVHTSKYIVENLLTGDLIRGRTVIFVTHHVGLASQAAEFIVTLEDGRVKSSGAISDLKRSDSTLFKTEGDEAEEEIAAEIEAVDGPVDAPAAEPKSDGKLVLAEEKAAGHISRRALTLLVKSLGGPAFWTVILLMMLINQFATLAQIWVLGAWARDYDVKPREDVSVGRWLSVYAIIVTIATFSYAFGAYVWALGSVRSGLRIHAQFMDAIFAATLRWLDSTPSGRIIARATTDVRALDGELTEFTRSVLDSTFSLGIKLITIAVVLPLFGVLGLLLGVVGAFIAELYIHAQMSCKRESSNKKAPLFSLFGDAIAGLVSVRAYDAEKDLQTEAERRANAYIRTSVSFYNLNRWCNVRLDLLAATFSSGLAAYLIYGPTARTPSTIGVVLSICVQFSSGLLMYVRIINMWEVSGNSLERMQDYIQNEKEVSPSTLPPAYWPSSGAVKAENLRARYSKDGPLVLKGLNFEIKSGERVGVVGRTGSGKSTLALALLRLIPTEGKAYIDNLDTSTINLNSLRSQVTIIPQDPTLTSGTLRINLDPFGEHDDAALLEVLKSTGLSTTSEAGADGTSTPHHLTLDSEISTGGDNLSQGQKQLVSLARGLVRRSKIFLLDEATASVDMATDNLIQTAIREELKDTTLITIAHRLKTIADYDRILCLDAGNVIEFDTPAALIKAGGQFAEMVSNSPDADELRQLAGAK